ncbi:SDR family NAD(P)-dependent oxidoreductase [Pseudomonas sp. R3.Fl]|jgi:NAD(P)-dependent dehydrogenase (short-subunit alcohol dehydrogenase family)|uniref:SDR family NAD(P)-dependent oxidoreductase n=1 Tax=Pseudomonas TaxID=286 RepID=UPI000731DF48|nr:MULTISPECIES: SDR family NAD(P)-dependent oxidoreductase [Pseudomonas]KSW22889.1 short-chain dehydrogenase [Pseudomonas sp. ADP]AMO77640.1 putative oxidoreductase [Pseudomonas citronellolis]MCL6692161.1 SDR family NAD(P)-dependent oxidoreductase [Pseudomonas sp. R3.Fl]MDN6875778.1 SDR family NAD(P)-dependent oxidoreductase [Pseudomonas citronellolis]OBP09202.1 3-oxoacyl-[acyl-carrier-protein] reductase [Pseudomonas sp. EGD-AKN5]
MSRPLQDKTIIVTGGFGALGGAVGRLLLERGAQVALLDRAEIPASLGDVSGVLPLGGVDLTSTESARLAVARVVERFGHLDGLINVAGGFAWESFEDGALDTWDRLYQINLRTALVSSQAALPYLLAAESGRIVNIGALASLKAGLGMGAYAASKSGVARLTETLAEELKDRGVTVNAVLPSIIDTPANRADMPDSDASRWVTPEALARVIAFLLSDDATPITGACLPVAGRV